MPKTGEKPLARPEMEKFAQAVAQGFSKRDAYCTAGYKGDPTGSQPFVVARNPKVRNRINFLRESIATRMVDMTAKEGVVTKSQITAEFWRTYNRAHEGTPLLAKDGSETGVKKPDLAVARGVLADLAKMNGMMIDVNRDENLDDQLENMSGDDLRTFVLGLLEQVDPNLRKRVAEDFQMNDRDEDDEEEAEIKVTEGTLLQ